MPCLLLGSERRCGVIRVSADSVDLCGILSLCRMLLCVRYSVSCSATTRSSIFECVERLETGR